MAYCIAFSADGATDVTRRYVRAPTKHALPRTKAPENVLIHILDEIRSMRRRDMDKKEKFRLEGEDMKEDQEFRRYIIDNLIKEISHIMPGTQRRRLDPDAQKAAEERERDAQWLRAGRNTNRTPENHQRDQGQR